VPPSWCFAGDAAGFLGILSELFPFGVVEVFLVILFAVDGGAGLVGEAAGFLLPSSSSLLLPREALVVGFDGGAMMKVVFTQVVRKNCEHSRGKK